MSLSALFVSSYFESKVLQTTESRPIYHPHLRGTCLFTHSLPWIRRTSDNNCRPTGSSSWRPRNSGSARTPPTFCQPVAMVPEEFR